LSTYHIIRLINFLNENDLTSILEESIWKWFQYLVSELNAKL
jgi:hypothetical protein